MPFIRILLIVVALMGLVVGGLAFFRPDPEVSVPQTDAAPVTQRPAPVAPLPRQDQPVMSPGDASSPAEITAQEAAEAQRRLEQEQQEPAMGMPDMTKPGATPPDLVRN